MITSDLHSEIVYDETPEEVVVKVPKKLNQAIICMEMDVFCRLVESYNDDVLAYQRSRRITLEKAQKVFNMADCPRQPINGLNNLIINSQRQGISGSPNHFKLFVDEKQHLTKVYGPSTRSGSAKSLTVDMGKLQISNSPEKVYLYPQSLLQGTSLPVSPSLAQQMPIPLLPAGQSSLMNNGQVLLNVPVVGQMNPQAGLLQPEKEEV